MTEAEAEPVPRMKKQDKEVIIFESRPIRLRPEPVGSGLRSG